VVVTWAAGVCVSGGACVDWVASGADEYLPATAGVLPFC
jgi:hypothetical protein